MDRALRDGPRLIGDLWGRQAPLIAQTLQSAGLIELTSDLSSDATPRDFLEAIPRELCRRLRFRRAGLWLLRGGELTLACSWPPGSRASRPGHCCRAAARGAPALAASPTPKSLSIPLRAWSGAVCCVVHLEAPVLNRVLSARDLALAERYGAVASSAFHRVQLKQMLAETQRLLESKTTAIKESHHRIMNNLQGVAGLLKATGVRAHSRPVREALGESAARVHAIAAVHEALQADGGSEADLRSLVDTLLRRAFLPFLEPHSGIRIRADVESYLVPARWASSLALVVNELVTNALKHAFPEKRGEITLTLRRRGEAVFTVSDDGGTLPAGPLDEGRYGLGLHLVKSIVCKDLGGSFEIVGGPRTAATARCPLQLPPGAEKGPQWNECAC